MLTGRQFHRLLSVHVTPPPIHDLAADNVVTAGSEPLLEAHVLILRELFNADTNNNGKLL